MQIRTAQYTPNSTGSPAVGYKYHIGEPNKDPTIDDNKLVIYDGINGAVTSNPLTIDALGFFQNDSGQKVNPWVNETSYARQIISTEGGVLDSVANFVSDIFNPTGEQGSVVDAVFNNFAVAIASDLTAYDTIYIESQSSGWEDTVAGPVDGFYAHADGTTGTPSSGTPASFFDSSGNGWREDDSQRIGDGDVTEARIATAAVTNTKLGNGSVTTAKLLDFDVTTVKIAGGAIDSTKLGTASVITDRIADLNVTEAKLATGSVTNTKLGTDSVSTIKIQDDAVTTDKIATLAVTFNELATNSVSQSKIQDLAVGNAEIQNNAITLTKMGNDSVGANEIIANAVGTSEIATNAITQLKMDNASIGQAELKTNTASGSIALSANGGVGTSDNGLSVVLSGGSYTFWLESGASSTTGGVEIHSGTVYGNPGIGTPITEAAYFGAKLINTAASPPTRFASVSYSERFITASPPFNLGNGDISNFTFIAFDAANKILATYSSPVPPWAYNGKTNITADRYEDLGGGLMKKFKKVWVRPTAPWEGGSVEEWEAGGHYEEVEITHDMKNADMGDIPHPFIGMMSKVARVVMLNPLCSLVDSINDLQDGGESFTDIINGNYIELGDDISGLNMPNGVTPVEVKWKNKG